MHNVRNLRASQCSIVPTGSGPFKTVRPGTRRLASRHSRSRKSAGPIAVGNLFGQIQKAFQGGQSQQKTATSQVPSVEFPPYQVLKKGDIYSIRFYPVYPAIQAVYQRRDEGYAALGGYMDGQNEGEVRFVETQPVVMRYPTQGIKTMRLYVGSRRGQPQPPESASTGEVLGSLPQPTNSDVRLEVGGGEAVAVLRFEGYITPVSAEAARQQLLSALQKDGVTIGEFEAEGGFRVAQYGALYSLSTRMNEMLLQVKL